MSNTVRNFPDSSDASDNALAAADANTAQRHALQDQTSPTTAANAVNLQGQYPTLPPDAVMPLAKAGLNANTPGTQQIADAAAKAKVKKGFGWHSIGDFVKAGANDVASAASTAAGAVSNAAQTAIHYGVVDPAAGVTRDVLKPGVRIASTVASVPYQGLLGEVRSIHKAIEEHGVLGAFEPQNAFNPNDTAYNAEAQTSLGQLGQQLHDGKGVDIGSGYFAGGTVGTNQATAARDTWAIGGSAATPGRVFASIATEPGTKPYNLLSGLVDAGASFYGDPANHLLGAAGDARAATKVLSGGAPTLIDDVAGKVPTAVSDADQVLKSAKPTALESKVITNGASDYEPIASQEHREASGIVDGVRRDVMPANALNWLQSNNGTKIVQKIADTDSYADLRRTFTNGADIDVDTLNELSKASTPGDVLNILKPTLGIQVREAPQLPTTLHNAAVNTFQTVFRRDPSDVRLLGEMPGNHIDVNDKNQAVTTLENFLKNAKLPQDQIDQHINAMADTSGPISMFDATKNAVAAVGDHIAKQADTPAPVARQMTKMFNGYRQELAKYFVDEVGDNAPVLGADIDGAGRPLPTPHLFSEYINRSIPLPDSRAIRAATGTYAKIINGLEGSDSAAVQKLGKSVAFGKAGIDGAGALNSFLLHEVWKPITLLRGAWPIRVVGEEQARMGAAGLDSMLAHPLSAMAWAAGRRGAVDAAGHAFTDDADAAGDMHAFAASQSHGSGGWRDRLALKSRVLYNRDDDGYSNAWANELNQLRTDPVARRVAGGWAKNDTVPQGLTGNNTEDAKRWFWNGGGSQFRKQLANANGRQGLLSSQRVSDAYIDSVADRLSIKTGDHPLLIDAVAKGNLTNDAGKTIPLRSGPAQINPKFEKHLDGLAANGVGPMRVQGQLKISQQQGLPKALAYYDKAVEAGFQALMSKPTNYLSRSPAFKQFYWDRMQELAPYVNADGQATLLANAQKANLASKDMDALQRYPDISGTLDLKHADLIAKGHALDQTRSLLYDMTKRSQFFDITRNVMPFGDAWAEIFKVWSKIGVDKPQMFRRAQQLAQGANQSGFFYNDPTTGEESFKYPGTAFVTKELLGVPVPLAGSVKSANIFGGVTPGFGPTVQWAANTLLPDKPQWDEVKNIISPYGEQDDSNGFLESYLPAWFQKFRQTGQTPFGRQDDRVWNNTVSDVAKALVSSGKYNTNSPTDIQQLMDAAKSKASWLYAVRGAAQFFAPSAPTPEFLAHDKDGSMTFAANLVQDYHDMETKDYKNATANFIDKYGTNNALYMQGTSKSATPATKADASWEQQHPDLAERYKGVFGLFAPPDATYDPTAAARQIATGERKPLAPDEVITAANVRQASLIWANASAKLAGRTDSAASGVRQELRDALMSEYSGWGSTTIGADAVTITKIQDAMKNPVIANTAAGQATSAYLMARDKVQTIAESRGLTTWTTAKSATDLRNAMRTIGDELVKADPAFGNLWDTVFSHEMTADETAN